MVEIAVLGHGVVGSGVAELLMKNSESIAKKAGEEIRVKYILDLRDFPDLPYGEKFIKDFNIILNDPCVKVVVEAMGGVNPAYDFIKASLEAGKSAVTSNKEMVAAKGAELLKIAREKNVNFMFEASVGGGIPVINPLHQCLAANEILSVAGILNGTTNFVLTKMISEGMDFDAALKIAQKLGYAEADPTADIDGHDACRKICILASLAFGKHVYPECVHTEGIRGITAEDVAYAENASFAIKLIGQTHLTNDCKVFILVCPALVPKRSQLAGVDDVFNAVLVNGDATGDVMFYGKGAGKFPTASAVIGDVVSCVTAKGNIPSLTWVDGDKSNIADIKAETATFYIRAKGGINDAAQIFGNAEFLSRENQPAGEIAFIVPCEIERDIEKKLEASKLEVLSKIRVLETE